MQSNVTAWPADARRAERTTVPREAGGRAFQAVHLLDADPDLGATLSPSRFADARSLLVARVHAVPQGPWTNVPTRDPGPGQIGLLVLDGVLSRELLMEDDVSIELLGEGDLIRPWQAHGPSRLLQTEVRWNVLQSARLAVLGPGFQRALGGFPEVAAVLIDRVTERAHRLALGQAISQLNGVDRRVLALFWHLAERWGRMTGDGVVVPLALPHRIIAQLVGARRPTVSTAIVRLGERGALERRGSGAWVLHGEPVGFPSGRTARVVELRRNRFRPADAAV